MNVTVKLNLGGGDLVTERYEFDGSLGSLSGALGDCAVAVNNQISQQMVKNGAQPPGEGRSRAPFFLTVAVVLRDD